MSTKRASAGMRRCMLACVMMALIAAGARGQQGPRLGDREFFEMLDLNRPGLGAVKGAVDRADWPAARHELASYMRARKSPHWEGDRRSATRVRRDPTTNRAEDALEHRFSSIGIAVQFGDHIDWHYNPTTAPGSKYAANHEWTWQFNRHQYWSSLAAAYRETGDEAYAAEFVQELKGWVHDCPVPMDAPANRPFSAWRTIECGIRMTTAWPNAFFGFLKSKSFDDDTLVLMLKGFADHAQYLNKFQTSGNWLAMEANGLYHVACLFPEFKDARAWREKAVGLIEREIGAQVYPDGAQIELAPGYAAITLDNFLGPLDLESKTGIAPPADLVARVEPMFNYFMYVMQPTRHMPPLNDSGAGETRRWMTLGAKLYPNRKDFAWFATNGREGTPPAHTSYGFPYAGQFVMRSGWETDALWMLMEAGPFGYKHQHEDKLGVLMTAYGSPLLCEGGLYTYDASPWRKYVLSSRAHNVVLVDGLEQNREHEKKTTYVVKKPLPHIWKSTPKLDHAAGYYDEGWGPKAERIVKQTRHVWFFKPEKCFVIADDMVALDGKEHTYEALFHLNAADAKVNGMRVDTVGGTATLAIWAAGADGVRIVKGQTEPAVQGWTQGASNTSGMRAIPTAIYSKRGKGKTTMIYVLYPSPGKESPLRRVTAKGDKVTLEMNDGSEKVLKLKR